MAVSTICRSYLLQCHCLHLIYNFFRKDNLCYAICLYVILIGSLVIFINKFISRRIIQRIPKPNILPRPTNNQEESFQMASFHSTPRIIQVRPIDKNYAGDLSLSHPQPKNDQEGSTQTSHHKSFQLNQVIYHCFAKINPLNKM